MKKVITSIILAVIVASLASFVLSARPDIDLFTVKQALFAGLVFGFVIG